MGSTWSSLFTFIFVIALIPLVLWMLKRSPIGGTASAGPMRVVASLPLAQNQRLVTVEVGSGDERRWLVLGVTAQSITTLHTMEPQEGAAIPGLGSVASPAPPFAQLLGRFRLDANRDQGNGNAR